MTEDHLAVLRDHMPPRFDAADHVLDRLSSAVYATDKSGVITYFNAAAADLWGREPVIGSSLWCGSFRIFTVEGAVLPHDACPMAQCLKTGKGIRNAEIVVERPDGRRCNVLVSPQPIFDERSELVGAINTLADISDLRRTEAARSSSARLSASILEHSKDCIKILDLDGALQTINASGCTSLGLESPASAIGRNYFDFWQKDHRDRALAAAAAAREKGAARFKADFVGHDGGVTTWDEKISLISNEDGVAIGYLVISRDVTQELHEAEAKSRKLLQQKTLSEIGALALRQGCFDDFMKTTVTLVAEALSLPMVKILAFADQADHLKLLAGVGWADGLAGNAQVGIDRESQAGFTLTHDGPVIVEDLRSETRFSGPPLLHEHGVRSGMSVTIPGVGARPFGVLGVHSDQLRQFDDGEVDYLVAVANLIASCHRQEEARTRQALLVREIAHRSGNMLQFVSSIFNQTVRGSVDLAEAKSKFEMRLGQMSRANILVSSDGWTKSNLRELVATTLEPFQSMVDLEGRDVMLPADLCFDLGLVLHELATNSAKYGAFAGGDDRVAIRWSVGAIENGARRFTVEWCDQHQKNRPPSVSSGFGTKLIKQLIEAKWAGKVEITLEPEFSCRISLPLPGG